MKKTLFAGLLGSALLLPCAVNAADYVIDTQAPMPLSTLESTILATALWSGVLTNLKATSALTRPIR